MNSTIGKALGFAVLVFALGAIVAVLFNAAASMLTPDIVTPIPAYMPELDQHIKTRIQYAEHFTTIERVGGVGMNDLTLREVRIDDIIRFTYQSDVDHEFVCDDIVPNDEGHNCIITTPATMYQFLEWTAAQDVIYVG